VRILFAVHHYPPHHTGGCERFVERRVAALRARGHEPRVLCVEHIDAGPPGGVGWVDDQHDGISVRRLSFDLAATPDPFRWSYDNPWIGEHLRILCREQRPDVFVLVGGYLLTGRVLRVAQELGIPTVLTLADFWFLCPRITLIRSDGTLSTPPVDAARCIRCLGEERRRYRWLGRLAPRLVDAFWRRQRKSAAALRARNTFLLETLAHVDVIISPCEFTRDLFARAGVAAERMLIWRQGQDGGAAVAAAPRPAAAPLRIGYIGQIVWHKGAHVLVDAVRRLPTAPLTVTIFGDPTHAPRYVQRLRRAVGADPRVQFAGPYAGRDGLADALRQLDVVVVPSLWYENSPMAILEAQAHRIPVITSDLGSMAELVRHGENGLLFAAGDADALAGQLRRLLSTPDLLATLRAGIGPVPRLDDEIEQMERLFASLMARGRAPVGHRADPPPAATS
jgi:glycosyltransferase involved in cell wall biosynthesis